MVREIVIEELDATFGGYAETAMCSNPGPMCPPGQVH
jgi:hypothetical protein